MERNYKWISIGEKVMKKVLFAIPFLSSGGAERVVSIWTSELAKLNMDIHLLLFYRVNNEYKVNERVKIHNLTNEKREYEELSLISKIKMIRNKLKEIKPDVVIPFITYVGLLMSLCSIGLKINIIETIRIDPRYSPNNKKIRFLRNLSVFFSKSCIVQNREQLEYFPKIMQKKISVFANPIANEFLASEKKFINRKIKNIVAVGRLEKQKGYKLLIEAFSNVSKSNEDIVLNIYGEGSLYNDLNEYIKEKDLESKVILHGRTNNIQKVLLDSDLYILSSEAEGMPNSLMEAMAIGLPCIATDCKTGPSDLIDNKINGVLISVNNRLELERAMYKMINDVEDSIKMAKEARISIINKYGAEASAKKLKKYIETI